MFNDEYLSNVYSRFERDEFMHLGNCKYFSGFMAKFINDIILSSGKKYSITDIHRVDYSIITKVNGDNASNRIEVIDYAKVSSYFQIVFLENNTCVRCFISPMGDNNVFFGYYSNYKPVKDHKFNKNVIVEEEGFTSIDTFNTPVFIIRMVDFLLRQKISNPTKTPQSILH